MDKILVLGAGRIGSYIANKLSDSLDVTVLDKNKKLLSQFPKYIYSDFRIDPKPFNLVVGALPGNIGYEAAKYFIGHGKDYVDISFCEEDLLKLNDLAVKTGSRTLIDFGLAPGLSHMLFGYYNSRYEVSEYKIYVGGNPVFPVEPWYYDASFSPADVLAEYTRPARVIRNGKVVELPALSEQEEFSYNDYKYIAFNTDGVRTLLRYKIDKIEEKTLRWPQHINTVNLLNKLNLLELAMKKAQWNEFSKDHTILAVNITYKDVTGKKCIAQYSMQNSYDNHYTSMAKTTGQTCIAGTSLLLENKIKHPGVFAPEDIGANHLKYILDDLRYNGISLRLECIK